MLTLIRILKYGLCLAFFLLLTACDRQSWNNPYPQSDSKANFYYTTFDEQPKTLDPARSYSVDEVIFIGQIYQPPLQYDYFKRPYELIPFAANKFPEITYLDNQEKPLPPNTAPAKIAYTVYKIQIQPGIYYQPHPAFACDRLNAQGECTHYFYLQLNAAEIAPKKSLQDFPKTGTRELVAEDFVYQIKRLASPRVQSPIYGFLSNHIVGMTDYNKILKTTTANKLSFLDLRRYDLAGVKILDKYTFTIKIKGLYPQFIYWLAMNFFAPVPWEADVFYSQPGMLANNLSLDWYPVGTGPYMLLENNPNLRMVLGKNPNFNPTSQSGPPYIEKFIFTLEKEAIPRWNKFLQGYYDQSAISTDSFDQAIRLDKNGNPVVTPLLKEKNIKLQTSVAPGIYYTGFNMLDPVVGGYSERARKLRQAIGIAFDTEEYISIFLNGRGISAQGPVPPGIFGYREGIAGMDPVIYQDMNGQLQRRSLAEAKKLLAEAGYPGGRDPKTQRALLLNFDVTSGGTNDRSYFAWLREQFAKLGIELQIRDTQYNRFQDKVRNGQAQIFFWGWSADYPDPENFLFLLYGPNGKVKYNGENASNYENAAFDKLFQKMRILPNGPERQEIINEMVKIVQNDSPWIGGFYPKTFLLTHQWVSNVIPSELINNTLKYWQVDPVLRNKMRIQWNPPIFWPVIIGIIILLIGLIPVFYWYWKKQRQPNL